MAKATNKIEGYVIKRATCREQDAMVGVLSVAGLTSFLGRGVLKSGGKNAPSCLSLAYSSFLLNVDSNSSFSLKEGKLLSLPDGRDSFERLSAFTFVSEITAKVIPEGEGKEVFPFLDAFMKAEDKGFDPFSGAFLYLCGLLRSIGCGLEVSQCVTCGVRNDIVGVSLIEGGFICANCLEAEGFMRLPVNLLKMLRYGFLYPPNDFGRVSFDIEDSKTLLHLLSSYFFDQTGVKIESLELLLN